MNDNLSRLLESGIIAVIRLESSENLVELSRALVRGGVSSVEITMTTPNALGVIEKICAELAGEALIGAGTVLDAATAQRAVQAGASFIVSPTLDPAVIEATKAAGALAIPGALSATEINRAMQLGADVVKLFPGRVATPGYFRDVLGPFPSARLMPTGNVSIETAPQYIEAGAVAVGVGKALVDQAALRERNWDALEERARTFRNVVDGARKLKS